ncbi:uncharacterized protein LOC118180960 [Stegodyphus dumicola]|uniref:uncharacterized protein LOC118180960 n=1 Tax=Stegodyphus dumicola TaxID=202533 RepID=UPI0015B0DB5D|nr:uncharacterized protein LOC118180960 [Stegodyphus dumicola]
MNSAYNEEIYNRAPIMIEDKICFLGGQNLQSFGLSEPKRNVESAMHSEICHEMSYNLQKLTKCLEHENKLVPDQKKVFETIVTAVSNQDGDKKDGCISLECIGNIVKSHQDLLLAIFPNLRQHFTDRSWLCESSILAPKNDTVRAVNKQLLGQLPGSVKIYKSVDTMCSIDEAVNYPIEFLNSLELTGVPSLILELKVGAPIMLFRNLDSL